MASWAQFEKEAADLAALMITSVEGDELVARLWHPGHPVKTFRRK
ncbi:hypothetical protein [Amycolatopsis taiwanensis]|nr:hypothetical protein [Amycolatopsis taiwanensis]